MTYIADDGSTRYTLEEYPLNIKFYMKPDHYYHTSPADDIVFRVYPDKDTDISMFPWSDENHEYVNTLSFHFINQTTTSKIEYTYSTRQVKYYDENNNVTNTISNVSWEELFEGNYLTFTIPSSDIQDQIGFVSRQLEVFDDTSESYVMSSTTYVDLIYVSWTVSDNKIIPHLMINDKNVLNNYAPRVNGGGARRFQMNYYIDDELIRIYTYDCKNDSCWYYGKDINYNNRIIFSKEDITDLEEWFTYEHSSSLEGHIIRAMVGSATNYIAAPYHTEVFNLTEVETIKVNSFKDLKDYLTITCPATHLRGNVPITIKSDAYLDLSNFNECPISFGIILSDNSKSSYAYTNEIANNDWTRYLTKLLYNGLTLQVYFPPRSSGTFLQDTQTFTVSIAKNEKSLYEPGVYNITTVEDYFTVQKTIVLLNDVIATATSTVENGRSSTNNIIYQQGKSRSDLIPGHTYQIYADYPENDHYLQGTGIGTLEMLKCNTTTTISGPESVTIGESATLTITVKENKNNTNLSRGSLAIYDGNTLLQNTTITGTSTSISYTPSTTGTHTIRVIYTDSGVEYNNSQNTLDIIVNKKQIVFSDISQGGLITNGTYSPIDEENKLALTNGETDYLSVRVTSDNGSGLDIYTLLVDGIEFTLTNPETGDTIDMFVYDDGSYIEFEITPIAWILGEYSLILSATETNEYESTELEIPYECYAPVYLLFSQETYTLINDDENNTLIEISVVDENGNTVLGDIEYAIYDAEEEILVDGGTIYDGEERVILPNLPFGEYHITADYIAPEGSYLSEMNGGAVCDVTIVELYTYTGNAEDTWIEFYQDLWLEKSCGRR